MQALQEFIDGVKAKFGAVIDWLAGKWDWIKSIFSTPIKATVEAEASGNGKKVATNAIGGIYKQGSFLTTFAEESPEAAIPIDGSPRAISLWKQTGAMLGMNIPEDSDGTAQGKQLNGFSSLAQRFDSAGTTTVANTSTSAVNVTFAPNIEVRGSGDEQAIGQVVRNEMERLKSMLEDIQNNGRRKSFA